MPLKDHFISSQTYHDVMIGVMLFLLLCAWMYSANGPLSLGLSFIAFLPSRLSSWFVEYVFAFCRTEVRNAASSSAHGGLSHVNHHIFMSKMEQKVGMGASATERREQRAVERGDFSSDTSVSQITALNPGFVSRIPSLIDVGISRALADYELVRKRAGAHDDPPTPDLETLKKDVLLCRRKRAEVGDLFFTSPRGNRNDTDDAGDDEMDGSEHGSSDDEGPDADEHDGNGSSSSSSSSSSEGGSDHDDGSNVHRRRHARNRQQRVSLPSDRAALVRICLAFQPPL